MVRGAWAKLCTLGYVDDATSRLPELRFAPESTFDCFESARRYLEQYGKPVAFYSDKLTPFGRAQDRLVKELRPQSAFALLARFGVSTKPGQFQNRPAFRGRRVLNRRHTCRRTRD